MLVNEGTDGTQFRVRVYGDLEKLNRVTEGIREKLAPIAQTQAQLAAKMNALQLPQIETPPVPAIQIEERELPDVEPILSPEPAAHAVRDEHRRDREERQRETASWWPSRRDWGYLAAGVLVSTLANVPVYIFVLG